MQKHNRKGRNLGWGTNNRWWRCSCSIVLISPDDEISTRYSNIFSRPFERLRAHVSFSRSRGCEGRRIPGTTKGGRILTCRRSSRARSSCPHSGRPPPRSAADRAAYARRAAWTHPAACWRSGSIVPCPCCPPSCRRSRVSRVITPLARTRTLGRPDTHITHTHTRTQAHSSSLSREYASRDSTWSCRCRCRRCFATACAPTYVRPEGGWRRRVAVRYGV